MLTPRSRIADAVLAAAVAAAGVAEIWVPFSSRQGEGSPVVSTVAVAAALAIAARRTHPLASGLVVLVAWPLLLSITPVYVLFYGQFVPMTIAVFSMARHGRGNVPWYGAAAGAAVLLYVDLFVEVLQSPGEIVFHWSVFAIAWGFGAGLRRHEQNAEEAVARAIRTEVEAAERAVLAVAEERSRIARELHDIVAHSVSTMVVQAGAAEQVVDDDPEQVRRALATIRSTGADALGEMRRLVTMLRDADEPGALRPQPGLAVLPGLVDVARADGLQATLAVEGAPRPLPSGVDLAAYRIVQEALTNVRRHASASLVSIRVVYGDDELAIEVADDGHGSTGVRPGNGLVGMRERASVYGGRIETATGSGRGFVVRAVLPTESGG